MYSSPSQNSRDIAENCQCVLVYYGCHNKIHRLGGLYTEIYFLRVMEARSPKSRYKQG